MDRVSIAGATLALLLQSGAASVAACDGVLLGQLSHTITSQAMDTADTLLLEQCTALVASSCACSSTHAFYTNTGAVIGDRLQALLASCGAVATPTATAQPQNKQLLGWFAYRPELPGVPSMLNAAVCQHLQAWMQQQQTQQQQQQPLLFCLITRHADHNGATVSLQARFFSFDAAQPTSSSTTAAAATHSSSNSRAGAGAAGMMQLQHPSFKPLEVHILNLGPQLQASQQAQPAAGTVITVPGSSDATNAPAVLQAGGEQRLSALAAALEPLPSSGSSGPLGAVQQQQLLAAGDAAGGQMAVVEHLYSSLLEELSVAAAAASEQRGQLAALEAENAALRHQLLARQQEQQQQGGGVM